MLQQTRSETVRRYHATFLRRFPNVESLARARESSVLAVWSGLGYYVRARNLHCAARVICKRHGGNLPRSVDALRQLPGVGRYTAGAIASIAFGVPAPVLDGNVARVLARLVGLSDPLGRASTERRLWRLAERLVPDRRPGDWNQALMELGATVCTARSPACARCPVARVCSAFLTASVDRLPRVTPRPRAVKERRSVAVVAHRGRFLLLRRDEGRLLRRLYLFPEPWELGGLGVKVDLPSKPAQTIRHSIVNRRIETNVYHATMRAEEPARATGGVWVPLDKLRRLPLSAVGLRIAADLSSDGTTAPRCPRP
jgi:A/G-specific adenine glycosylase